MIILVVAKKNKTAMCCRALKFIRYFNSQNQVLEIKTIDNGFQNDISL